jgi:hypothetical protein
VSAVPDLGPVLAFEVRLRPGADQDDGLAIVSAVSTALGALGGRATDTTVTDVARLRAERDEQARAAETYRAELERLHAEGRIYANADPWFTQHEDGSVTATWPEGVDRALIARELVDVFMALSKQWGDAQVEIARLRALLGEALDRWDSRCGETVSLGLEDPRIAEIRAEAGLS